MMGTRGAAVKGNKENKMENVEELMKILMLANKLSEESRINILVEQINEMENNYAAIMQELTDIKGQLNEVLSRQGEGTVSQTFKEFGAQIDDFKSTTMQNLENVKQDLDQKAGMVVQKFKDTGVKALNKVCEFLGIQEKLVELRDQTRSSERDMRIKVEKIDQIEKELHGATEQIKNVGRILADKEPVVPTEKTKDSSLLQMIKKHYAKRQKAYTKRAEKLDRAIEKFHALEQKASVLGKLSENKEQILANEKSNENERSTAKETVHRKEEAER